jgi:hypothetical protein
MVQRQPRKDAKEMRKEREDFVCHYICCDVLSAGDSINTPKLSLRALRNLCAFAWAVFTSFS